MSEASPSAASLTSTGPEAEQGEASPRPAPAPSEVSEPYWQAIAEKTFAIQRCEKCGHWNHPPGISCGACGHAGLSFEPVSGHGVIYQFVVVRQSKLQGFEERTPYAVAAVELDEQPRLVVVTNIVGQSPDSVAVGQRVHVVFETSSTGPSLPQFTSEPSQ